MFKVIEWENKLPRFGLLEKKQENFGYFLHKIKSV